MKLFLAASTMSLWRSANRESVKDGEDKSYTEKYHMSMMLHVTCLAVLLTVLTSSRSRPWTVRWGWRSRSGISECSRQPKP